MVRSLQPLFEEIPLPGSATVSVRRFNLPAFEYPWHQHPEVELTWILEGSGLRHVGDSVEPFATGDFCLLGSGLPHAWQSVRPDSRGVARSFVVQFDPARFGDLWERVPEFSPVRRLLDRAGRGLQFPPEMGARLLRKFTCAQTPLSRFAALLETLDELGRALEARPLSLATWTLRPEVSVDPRIQRVLTHLATHYNEPSPQAELARMIRLSPASFSRLFRHATGRTFKSYVTDLRLSVACRQLLETDEHISQIAFATGFENLSSFNRTFRLRRGVTPGDFRRAR